MALISADDELDEIANELKKERHRFDPHVYVHSPNKIPIGTRITYLALSTLLIAYGLWSLHNGSIYFPGKRGPGVYFFGPAMWALCAAIVAATVNMLSVVVDHYDHRNNEASYRTTARISCIAGWILLVATFIVGVINDNYR